MENQKTAVQSNGKNRGEPFTPQDWEKYYDEANWHEAAKIFPMLTADELPALADDIHKHGLLNPIVLADGKVIDGRNRLLPCRVAGVTPTFVELKETNLPRHEWVIAQNIRRRHLTPTQLAVVAFGLLPLFEAEAKKRQQAHGGTAPGKAKITAGNNSTTDDAEGSKSRTQAAKSVGVNERYISDVKRIKEKAPELFAQMRDGTLTIPEACRREKGNQVAKRNHVPSSSKSDDLPPVSLRAKAFDALISFAEEISDESHEDLHTIEEAIASLVEEVLDDVRESLPTRPKI